jgi:tetratricopeptide (TPR) repeat protein
MGYSVASLARNLIRQDDLSAADSLLSSELSRCGDEISSEEFWSLHLLCADLMRLRGGVEQALEYLRLRELERPVPDGVVITVGLAKLRGYCEGLLGNYTRSHAILHQSEALAGIFGLLELQCEVRQCMAMIFYLQQDYTASDRTFRLILDASEKLDGWYFRANALWGIGKNLMIQGHHEAAIPWLTESLRLFEEAKARLSMATAWSELAVCYLGLGADRKSLELLLNALQIMHEAGTVQNYQVVLANIGNVYLHRGDHLRAIEYYRQALVLAREIKDPVSIEKWSYNIRLAYARLRQAVDQLDSQTA